MAACQNLLIRFTTASFMSPTADASVCTAKKLISARSSQDKPWGSKKSKKVFGWSALWSTISATSIWRKKLCSLSTTLLAQKCNLCLRYDLSPMSPGRTFRIWSGRWESNPRPKLGKLLYCHCTTPALMIKLANGRGGLQGLSRGAYQSLGQRNGCKPTHGDHEFGAGGKYGKKRAGHFGPCNSRPGSGSYAGLPRGGVRRGRKRT